MLPLNSDIIVRTADKYAFYGTLRLKMENFIPFADQIEYIKTVTIKGYKMYSLGDYPYILKTGLESDRIVCDLCRVANSSVCREIDEMEITAGYECEDIEVDGEFFRIFVYKNYIPGTPQILSGDWVRLMNENNFSSDPDVNNLEN